MDSNSIFIYFMPTVLNLGIFSGNHKDISTKTSSKENFNLYCKSSFVNKVMFNAVQISVSKKGFKLKSKCLSVKKTFYGR